MKNKNKLIVLLVATTILLTGCTKILKTSDNKVVKNTLTGQSLTENILCQPEAVETIKIYKENKLDISKLPKCDDFQITSGGYEGVWTTIFVKPLAWLIIKIGLITKNYGISIILITMLIRIVMMPITKKTALQSENMKKMQPEMAIIEKKYKNKKDQESMMQKSQETMVLYKKHDINPMSGCIFSFIQIPLFFAFYEAMNRLPAIFEEVFGPFQLGTSPMVGIQNGQYYYAIFIIGVSLTTYFSFKLNKGASMSKEQEDQMKMMMNIMFVMITFTSLFISTGIALYWVFNSGFTIIQNLYVKRRKKVC